MEDFCLVSEDKSRSKGKHDKGSEKKSSRIEGICTQSYSQNAKAMAAFLAKPWELLSLIAALWY